MWLYRIAVITENEEIADFFKLELNLFNIAVDVLGSAEGLEEEYPFAVVDTDTCQMPENCQFPVVPLSGSYTTRMTKDDIRLGWPPLLTDIQRLSGVMLADVDLSGIQLAVTDGDVYISMDEGRLEAELDGCVIKLSKNEYVILRELCEYSGKTVKRERIMELLGATEGNISDVYICHLRRKLEANSVRRLIFTERGKGYYTVLRKK